MSTVLSVFSFTGYNQGNADDDANDNDMLLLMLFLMLLLSPLRPFLPLLISINKLMLMVMAYYVDAGRMLMLI